MLPDASMLRAKPYKPVAAGPSGLASTRPPRSGLRSAHASLSSEVDDDLLESRLHVPGSRPALRNDEGVAGMKLVVCRRHRRSQALPPGCTRIRRADSSVPSTRRGRSPKGRPYARQTPPTYTKSPMYRRRRSRLVQSLAGKTHARSMARRAERDEYRAAPRPPQLRLIPAPSGLMVGRPPATPPKLPTTPSI